MFCAGFQASLTVLVLFFLFHEAVVVQEEARNSAFRAHKGDLMKIFSGGGNETKAPASFFPSFQTGP